MFNLTPLLVASALAPGCGLERAVQSDVHSASASDTVNTVEVRTGPESETDGIRRALGSSVDFQRRHAIYSLWEVSLEKRDVGTVARLALGALSDDDQYVRNVATQILSEIGGTDVECIAAMMDLATSESTVRTEALEILRVALPFEYKDTQRIATLTRRLRHLDGKALSAALIVLGKCGRLGEGGTMDMLEVLERSERHTRLWKDAIWALTRVNPARVLVAGDHDVRVEALSGLQVHGEKPAETVSTILAIVADDDEEEEIRIRCAYVLSLPGVVTGSSLEARAEAVLTGLLEREAPEGVKVNAAHALGHLKRLGEKACGALAACILDGSEEVAIAAARAYSWSDRKNRTVSDAALSRLDNATGTLRACLVGALSVACENEWTVNAIIASALDDEDRSVRLAGAHSLGRVRTWSGPVMEGAARILRQEPVSGIQRAIARALGVAKVSSEVTIEALVAGMRGAGKASPECAFAVHQVLPELRDEASAILARCLLVEPTYERTQGLLKEMRRPGEVIESALILALKDHSPEIRRRAIRVLALRKDWLGNPEVVLRPMTEDADPEVRKEARRALAQNNDSLVN